METEDGHEMSGRAYGAKIQKGPIRLAAMSSFVHFGSPTRKSPSPLRRRGEVAHERLGSSTHELHTYEVSEPDDDDTNSDVDSERHPSSMYHKKAIPH